MAGLRQRQKLDRERRIVEAAATLFREFGYDGARIEAIAERANLSVGTIYNYYESKGDLLVAIVSLEVNEVIAAGEAVLDQPPTDAARAIDALFDIYLRHSLHYLSKEMWRTAMAIATLTPTSREGAHYYELDEALCQQVTRLLTRLHHQGIIHGNCNVEVAGRVLFNTMNAAFGNFVRTDEIAVEALLEEVSAQTALMASLLTRSLSENNQT